MIDRSKTILILYISLHSSFEGIETHAGCNSPNGIQVTIKFDFIPPNKLYLDAPPKEWTVKAKPSGDDDTQLKWKFGDFTFPDGDTGTNVKFKFKEWPDCGSFFGEKYLKLEYLGGIGECIDQKKVKVYFPPTKMINNEPAWFKYWPYKATPDLAHYTVKPKGTLALMAGYMTGAWGLHVGHWSWRIESDGNFFFRYGTPSYYIAEEAYVGGSNLNHAKKIENIAEVLAHEAGHHEYDISVRKPMVDNWWAALSPTAKQAYRDGPASVLSSAISNLIYTTALANASETYALTKNANYSSYVTLSEDWSKGGENDK